VNIDIFLLTILKQVEQKKPPRLGAVPLKQKYLTLCNTNVEKTTK
jgi:hypothetical protein